MTAVKVRVREAAGNAAAQAVQEPLISRRRGASWALESGFGEAAQNVLMAGAVGAALHPVFYLRAASRSLRGGHRRRPR